MIQHSGVQLLEARSIDFGPMPKAMFGGATAQSDTYWQASACLPPSAADFRPVTQRPQQSAPSGTGSLALEQPPGGTQTGSVGNGGTEEAADRRPEKKSSAKPAVKLKIKFKGSIMTTGGGHTHVAQGCPPPPPGPTAGSSFLLGPCCSGGVPF
jgi:hypothetical protein